jgi:hypothetical protein
MRAGFKIYPECGGWDLVLVRGQIQIGIQAKLRFNAHVLAQALCDSDHGPHYRAIACPISRSSRSDAVTIADRCRLLVLDMSRDPKHWLLVPPWLRFRPAWRPAVRWRPFRWPGKRLWLPPEVPDLPAGVPSPEVVGPWQLLVCEAEALARHRGWLAKADLYPIMKAVGAQCRAETVLGHFYECTGERLGPKTRACKWVLHPRWHPASKRYPTAWAMVKCAARSPRTGGRCRLRPGHTGRHQP